MLLELPQIWFNFKPRERHLGSLLRYFQKENLCHNEIFLRILERCQCDIHGKIWQHSLVQFNTSTMLYNTNYCLHQGCDEWRCFKKNNDERRQGCGRGKERNFFVRYKPFPQPPFHSSHNPLTPKISSSSLQLCAWLPSL